MENIFRVINYDGDIEISIYKKANAVFKTNEYNETEDVCIHKETVNIFNLLKKNQELKEKLDKYENPEDMTLMMMWCTEKVKDENKKLQERVNYLERSNNRREDIILEQRQQIES